MSGQGRRANVIVGALVAFAVVAALVALVVSRPGADAPSGQLRAIVHAGDGAVYELPLNRDAELEVATDLGSNTVVVQNGAVFVRDADCDNLDCVRQGAIDAPGKQIICLPHRLWIEVVDADAAGASAGRMDIDAVAGGDDGIDTISR